MTQFISLGCLSVDRFPQVEGLYDEHGPAFVEIEDGDASLPRRVDFSTVLTAPGLVEKVNAEGLTISVTTDDYLPENAATFEAAGWKREKGYFSGDSTFTN